MEPESERCKLISEAQEVAGLPVSNSEECVQTLQLNVSLPSGQCAALSLPLGATVLDLKTAAEQSLEQAFLRLAAPDGRFLDPTESLRASGLQSGDHVTAVAQQVKVSATDGAMVLWSVGGDQVIASGDARRGGCTAAVQDQLRSVQKIQATAGAFAAMLATGSVVTWGSPDEGGDSTEVKDQLLNVQQIHATRSAFAAILADGRVVTWGCPGSGGDSTEVKDQLRNVQQIHATRFAFAAILADGSVVTWGCPGSGGDSTRVKDQLRNVQQIHATDLAFDAVLADGTVVKWGSQGDMYDPQGIWDSMIRFL